MEKTVQSALSLTLGKGGENEDEAILLSQIQEIREQFDKQFTRWPPHINLLYPFIGEDEFETEVSRLGEVLKEVSPFSISFPSLSSFDHSRSSTAWADPTCENNQIHTLQSLCESVFPHCSDLSRFQGGYSPHLTLGQFKKKSKLRSFLSNVFILFNNYGYLSLF